MGTPATSLAKIPVISAANLVSTVPQVAGVHVPLFAGFDAIGAAASHTDAGFRDESLKTVGLALKPGTSAIVAITSKAILKSFRKEIEIEDARAFVANLSTEISNKLDEGKSLALAIRLAESGLAMQEVAVNENSTEVIVMALTNDAVLDFSRKKKLGN